MTVVIEQFDNAYVGIIPVDKETNLIGYCLMLSQYSWVGRVDGEIACMWGLIPPTLLSSQAYLWLHTTDLVNAHKFLFIRHSQRMMERMLKEYDIVVGHAHVDNTGGIRWLKWLGAKFGQPEGFRVPFSIRKVDLG